MSKAIIFYSSRSGRTKNYSEEIAIFLKDNNLEVKVVNVLDYQNQSIDEYDLVFIGCWTHGLFFFAQHPDKNWKEFAKKLPLLNGKKLILFTTYKIAAGSIFMKMKKHINDKINDVKLELKSKSAELSEKDMERIKIVLRPLQNHFSSLRT